MGDAVSTETGLYFGFEGFRSPADADFADAVRTSLVVLDTNVLLNLYTYQGSSLDEFIDVFEAFDDRLFVPHQVIDEFWRNRRTVLAENQGRHRELDKVQTAFDEVETAFRKWHQRVVDRLNPPPTGALKELEEAKTAILDHMATKNAEAAAILPDTPTFRDRVLDKLEPMLRGRVGTPPTKADLEDLRREGRQRVAGKVPPGYMDGEKNPERAIGDFLVWRQTMEASRVRDMDVLLVTQDQKEDWWADRGTPSQRARPELVAELLEFSGHRLLMIRAHDLLRLGSEVGVRVSEATVAEAESTIDEVEGWTVDAAWTYLKLLTGNWPDHFNMLQAAVESGGEIKRSEMAKHLRRRRKDSMHGVGKPYITALRRLVDHGDLPEGALVPLSAAYENGGWMSSFVMPETLVPMFKEALVAASLTEDQDRRIESPAPPRLRTTRVRDS